MPDRRPEDYDRDFEQLVSGLEFEGDFDEPDESDEGLTTGEPTDLRQNDKKWFRLDQAIEEVELDPEPESRYKPPPLPPLTRPSVLAAVGWLCMSLVFAVIVLTIVGLRLPAWLGYLAVAAFVAGTGVLLFKLPRDRDSDDDGAVV